MANKVVLITGAARRVGAIIARELHQQDCNVILHYRHSQQEAEALAAELNQCRENSAALLPCDLAQVAQIDDLIKRGEQCWGRLDALVNNASTFYPTMMGSVTEAQWHDLFASNAKAPFFLSQAAAPALRKQGGCIVNIADIHGQQALKHYPVYCSAKAALLMLTKGLAKELAPTVRVNAIAPGNMLPPEGQAALSDNEYQAIVDETLLKQVVDPQEVAKMVKFLIVDAQSMTGEVLVMDGGRSC